MVPVYALPVAGIVLLALNKAYSRKDSFLHDLVNAVALSTILAGFHSMEKKDHWQLSSSILKPFLVVLITLTVFTIFNKYYFYEKQREEWVFFNTGRESRF
ncbi:MAG TPA: hypothetical protein PLC42_06880 [Parachlamydiaceae bacterium]|nr:hypothetical protein [Parachlamydiaceae bacterium]